MGNSGSSKLPSVSVNLRVSPQVKEELTLKAAKYGLSVSEYVRHLLLADVAGWKSEERQEVLEAMVREGQEEKK